MLKSTRIGIGLIVGGIMASMMAGDTSGSAYAPTNTGMGLIAVFIGILMTAYGVLRRKNWSSRDAESGLDRDTRRIRSHEEKERNQEKHIEEEEHKDRQLLENEEKMIRDDSALNNEYENAIEELKKNPSISNIKVLLDILQKERNETNSMIGLEQEMLDRIIREEKEQKTVEREEDKDTKTLLDDMELDRGKLAEEQDKKIKEELFRAKKIHNEDERIITDQKKLKRIAQHVLLYGKKILKCIEEQIKILNSVNQKTKVNEVLQKINKLQEEKISLMYRIKKETNEEGIELNDIDKTISYVEKNERREERKDVQLRKITKEQENDPTFMKAA